MTNRSDNIIYVCGHTGHTILPEKYDGRLVTAKEFLTDIGHPEELRHWICIDCGRKKRQLFLLDTPRSIEVGPRLDTPRSMTF